MKISQLIHHLQSIMQTHGDLPIRGTWETTIQPIDSILVVDVTETEKLCLLSVDDWSMPPGNILETKDLLK